MSVEEMRQQIEATGKRVNQRLRQLEKSGYTGSNAYRWVERQAGEAVGITKSKTGNVRFERGTKGLNKNQLRERLVNIKMFEQSPTSTIRGVNAAYKKGYESFIASQNIDSATFTFQDYVDIFESSNLEHFKTQFGSEYIVKMIQSSKTVNKQGKTQIMSGNDIKRVIEGFTGRTVKGLERRFKKEGGGSFQWQSIKGDTPFD